ncbi:MAG TPA: twin-arginine translocation signal domain-containing protein [Gemmatimonadaceae bacterium]
MSSLITSTTARRGFLGRLAAAAAAVGLSSVPSKLSAETLESNSSSDAALDAWFGKLKGEHRVVFDVPEPNSGMGAIWPRVYLDTMKKTYGGDATAVVILRHGGIPLAMNDALWSKYAFGEMFKINDGDAPATKNIYASITNLPLPGLGIAELMKSGVLVGVCDVALTVYSAGAAQKMSMAPDAVKKEWIAGLLPGVQIVPSGVLGVARSQELGAKYIFAG